MVHFSEMVCSINMRALCVYVCVYVCVCHIASEALGLTSFFFWIFFLKLGRFGFSLAS